MTRAVVVLAMFGCWEVFSTFTQERETAIFDTKLQGKWIIPYNI